VNGSDILAQTAGSSFFMPMSYPKSWTYEDRRAWAGGGPGCDRCRLAAIDRVRDDTRLSHESAAALIARFRAHPSAQLVRELAALPDEILVHASAFAPVFAAVFASANVRPYETVTARTTYKRHAIRPSYFKVEVRSREPLARITATAVCDRSGGVFSLLRGPHKFSETHTNDPSTTVYVVLPAGDNPQLEYEPGTPPDMTANGSFPSHICTNGLAYAAGTVTYAGYLSSLLQDAASILLEM